MMVSSDLQQMITTLSSRAELITSRLLVPAATIQPSTTSISTPKLREQFASGSLLYQRRDYTGALRIYEDLEAGLDISQGWLRRVAGWNAAACALASDKNEYVVNVLHNAHVNGSLYGVPLWNLAVAYYRLGRIDDTLLALKSWIARDRENNPFRHAKCELIIACLSAMSNDVSGVEAHLSNACAHDQRFVANQIETHRSGSQPAVVTQATETAGNDTAPATIPAMVRERLIAVVQPKRPDRNPALSTALTVEEMESYARALELLADGDFEQCTRELGVLRVAYPGVWLLDHATAAALMFAGNHEAARDILLHAEREGHQLNGAALWNLACAQIHAGDLSGARRALLACSETEYRTKPQLWVALKALESDRDSSPQTAPLLSHAAAPSSTGRFLTEDLPHEVDACRLEVLSRIVKPKKMTKAYRPDLGRLPLSERQNVASILDSAHRATSAEAVGMLLPLVEQYPDLYTLKAHAAAHLLLNNQQSQARSLLRQASSLRSLDTISRYNYTSILLRHNDIVGVANVLAEGATSSLAEEYTFWLALAVARAILGDSRASDSAARALALVVSGPSASIVRTILARTDIHAASPGSTEQPSIIAARNAIAKLEDNDIDGAVQILRDIRVSAERIPEIGLQVLAPQVAERPDPRWDPEVVSAFTSAVRLYAVGEYSQAAAAYTALYQASLDRAGGPVLNLAAAYLQAGEPSRARATARAALRRHRRSQIWAWRLAYNYALAQFRLGDVARAIQIVEQYRRISLLRLTGLLIALCDSPNAGSEMLEKMASELDALGQSVYTPSDSLMINLAWAKLAQKQPDADLAMTVLRTLVQRSQRSLLQPAAEVTSMQQVRAAFDYLSGSGETNEVISYMSTIIETRTQKRQSAGSSGITSRELEHSVGVELAARLSLARAFDVLKERERAIRELDEAETLIKDHVRLLAPGFLARDWHELAQVAALLRLPWAAIRYCEQGLTIEPENKSIGKLKSDLLSEVQTLTGKEGYEPAALASMLEYNGDIDLLPIIDGMMPFSSVLAAIFREIGGVIERNDDNIDTEELFDRAAVVSRMELPDELHDDVELVLMAIVRKMGRDEVRIAVDIDAHDEKIWPRIDDDREGTCLLAMNSRRDIPHLVVQDLMSERQIWEGPLESGKPRYVRWTFYREDGFSPGTSLDLPLLLRVEDSSAPTMVRTAVTVLVGSSEPIWPSYPTGALTPDDVPGEELYGRLQLIRTITRSFGARRNQATYFIQAPRQMGKTSLLYFVKKQLPAHVLPVYVNLEKQWSKQEPGNVWNYLVQRVHEETSGTSSVRQFEHQGEAELIEAVANVCERYQKSYLLFLIDELHFLFEKSAQPSDVLATFRDFLNNQDNRIALLLSDRYTRDELESRYPSEYWAQLSLLNLGPLDPASAKQAIEFPTRGTDVSFLPETIDRLYNLTGGYPYHLQRAAQYLLESMYSGPWLTALPSDIETVVGQMLDQDILFQSGLCRPDRVDVQVADAIAALLEWRDLCDFLPILTQDLPDAPELLKQWRPNALSFLTHLPDCEQIIGRLKGIGIFRADGSSFFSPLLEQWLRKMRKKGKSLTGEGSTIRWQTVSAGDGNEQSARVWQNIDSELVRCAKYRGKPPLKERSTRADDWETLVREVMSEHDFCLFLDAAFRLFIDEREERTVMLQYPWLYYTYHRTRLIRNYVVHRSKSRPAVMAWDTICTNALGGDRSAYWPAVAEEWRAIQVALLRSLYTSMKNSVDIAGRPG